MHTDIHTDRFLCSQVTLCTQKSVQEPEFIWSKIIKQCIVWPFLFTNTNVLSDGSAQCHLFYRLKHVLLILFGMLLFGFEQTMHLLCSLCLKSIKWNVSYINVGLCLHKAGPFIISFLSSINQADVTKHMNVSWPKCRLGKVLM